MYIDFSNELLKLQNMDWFINYLNHIKLRYTHTHTHTHINSFQIICNNQICVVMYSMK
jgi:hypothetical protein